MKYVLLFLLPICPVFGGTLSQELKPFVSKYCVACHGEKKQKAKLRLDNLSTDLTDLKTAEQWQDVLDELNAAAMPPEDELQPAKKQFTDVLQRLAYELAKAKKLHYGKKRETVMRRLNKREYINTIYDLTGVPLKNSEVIEDQSTAEFDNHGEGLYVSSFLLGKYRQYAHRAIGMALSPKPAQVFRYEKSDFAEEKNSALRKAAGQIKANEFKHKKNSVEKQKARYAFLSSYLAQPDTDEGLLLEDGQPVSIKPRTGHANLGRKKGAFRISIKGRIKNLAAGDRPYLIIKERYVDISELVNGRKEMSFDVYLHLTYTGSFPLTFYVQKATQVKGKNQKWNKYSIKPIDPDKPKFILSSFKIVSTDKSQSEDAVKKIFAVEKGGAETDEQYIKRTLQDFAHRAYRGRPISDRFLKLLTDLYQANVANGLSQTDAIKKPLALILSSPKFIYLTEASSAESKYISDLELAVRLSYFLWSSPPDQELYRLARSGKLSDKQTLHAQLIRLLEDERSGALGEGFVDKWLEMEKLNLVDVESRLKGPRHYNAQIEQLLRQEPREFFRKLALDNLSIVNMISSDFVVVNKTLANYYRLPAQGVSENAFEILALPKDSPRGGLLGMGAILAMLGNGKDSSPVLRGKFVLSRMMGMVSPPPPPNVPDLDIQVEGNVRERLLAHQAKPQCASCHNRIDPAGFGLEIFDQAGQLRRVDDALKKILPGKLPSLGQYESFLEQRQLLLKNKDNFAKAFVEHLASYAFARKIGFSDAVLIDRILSKTNKDGYKLRDILREIVLSDDFRVK
jgi:hypothetical protein